MVMVPEKRVVRIPKVIRRTLVPTSAVIACPQEEPNLFFNPTPLVQQTNLDIIALIIIASAVCCHISRTAFPWFQLFWEVYIPAGLHVVAEQEQTLAAVIADRKLDCPGRTSDRIYIVIHCNRNLTHDFFRFRYYLGKRVCWRKICYGIIFTTLRG